MTVHPAPSAAAGLVNGSTADSDRAAGPLPALRTEVSGLGSAVVSLRVRGDVDATTLARLRTQLAHLLAQRPATLVLDVSEVSFLSARGLATLLETRDTALRRGVDLRLVCGSRAVSRPLELTGFDSLFTRYQDAIDPLPRPRNGG